MDFLVGSTEMNVSQEYTNILTLFLCHKIVFNYILRHMGGTSKTNKLSKFFVTFSVSKKSLKNAIAAVSNVLYEMTKISIKKNKELYTNTFGNWIKCIKSRMDAWSNLVSPYSCLFYEIFIMSGVFHTLNDTFFYSKTELS